MSISFSGLVSGLDTTSWIESLVQLKQAKVNTLEVQRKEIATQRQALNGIKSYFSSFQSLIQKVTDAKLGISSMDLFGQNVANVSNVSILSATATTNAQEGKYAVTVQNLATATKAISGATITETITDEKRTAKETDTLGSLGMANGTVKINGKSINIDTTKTIADLKQQLWNEADVVANFDNETGVFSMDAGVSAITNDSANFVNALHLDNVNKGYISANSIKTWYTYLVDQREADRPLKEFLGSDDGEKYYYTNGEEADLDALNESLSQFDVCYDDGLAGLLDGILHEDGRFDAWEDVYSLETGEFNLTDTTVNLDDEIVKLLGVTKEQNPVTTTIDFWGNEPSHLIESLRCGGDFSFTMIGDNGSEFTYNVDGNTTAEDFVGAINSQSGWSAGLYYNVEYDSYQMVITRNGNTDFICEGGDAEYLTNLFNEGVTYNYNGDLTRQVEQEGTRNVTTEDKIGISGRISVQIGNNSPEIIDVSADDNYQALIDKFEALGLDASLQGGKFSVTSNTDEMVISVHNSLATKLNLQEQNQDCASTQACEVTLPEYTKTASVSAANYADKNTKLSTLGITNGKLTFSHDGVSKSVTVDNTQDLTWLENAVNTAFGTNCLELTIQDNGQLSVKSTVGKDVLVGANTDGSNFVSICGLNGNGTEIIGTKSLYKVDLSSKLTTAGLFRNGKIDGGNFIVGDETFTIDDNTTLESLINDINASEKANVTARWDATKGELVLESKVMGSGMINVASGTSNITDIMGFTTTIAGTSSINGNSQTLGEMARFTIDGKQFTSNSNTVGSDITRIEGLTLNLKNVTENETVTVSVEKDKDTLATSLAEIVDGYNELIGKIDEELSATGDLKGQTTLKYLKKQLRNLMVGSLGSLTGGYRNLSAIGISIEAASSGNISTQNVDKIVFDEDTFKQAYSADSDAVKTLLVGDESKNINGIFSQINNLIENSLSSNGFFGSAERSYTNKLTNLSDKITRQSKSIQTYRARLERKFGAMELLISNIQQQYSSFLV